MNEAVFFILLGVFVVSALVTALVAASGRGPSERRIPLVVGWFVAVGAATVVFAVLYGNEGSGEGAAAEGTAYVRPGQAAAAEEGEPSGENGGEESSGAGESPEEEAEKAPHEAEQESSVGNAGEQLEGEAGPSVEGGDPESGAVVFSENCSTCHGATGHGGNGGPDLRTMPLAQTEAGAIEQVTNGGGGMPPFGGTLSEEEIENVAAYVVQEIAHAE